MYSFLYNYYNNYDTLINAQSVLIHSTYTTVVDESCQCMDESVARLRKGGGFKGLGHGPTLL